MSVEKICFTCVVRDTSVGIQTRYWLDGPGIESRWRRIFPHQSRLSLGSIESPMYYGYRVFPGGKAAGVWRRPPTPSSAEVKERIELYLFCAFVACSRVRFAFTFHVHWHLNKQQRISVSKVRVWARWVKGGGMCG